jgi:hypothetical protein
MLELVEFEGLFVKIDPTLLNREEVEEEAVCMGSLFELGSKEVLASKSDLSWSIYEICTGRGLGR